jgi:hypothetical protein
MSRLVQPSDIHTEQSPRQFIVWTTVNAVVVPAVVIAIALVACDASPTAKQPKALRPTAPPSSSPSGLETAPSPAPASSPSPLVEVAALHPICRTAQLQIQPVLAFAALSNDLRVFEIRNRSAVTCDMFGYPGVSGLDARGQVYGVAQRDSGSYFGDYPAPHRVALLADTPEIQPESDGLPMSRAPVPGHAYFDVTYGAACNGGVRTPADRWRIFPPDEVAPILIFDQAAAYSNCGLRVLPVGDRMTPSAIGG